MPSIRAAQLAITLLLVCVALAVGVLVGLEQGSDTIAYEYTLALDGVEASEAYLHYGVWPELSNADYYLRVRDTFIAQRTHFIEADLANMVMRVYHDGSLKLTVPIKSKGREGSWWETPSGLYEAQAKVESHFSSFGRVYMPYSIPFQGNFFIHGWPHYADGTPVAEGYSGGCIRLADEHAAQVFALTEVGMPILVHEASASTTPFRYALSVPKVSSGSYLVADLASNFVLLSGNESSMVRGDVLVPLMAALVATEHMNIERTIRVVPSMFADATSTFLTMDTSYRLYDLLFPLLRSGSFEVVDVLRAHFGESWFGSLMNGKARALGMEKTEFFRNDGTHVTTAEDTFLLLKYLRENRSFILSMTAGGGESAAYARSVFRHASSTHPLHKESYYAGGAAFGLPAASSSYGVGQEAAVLLLFASTTQPHQTNHATREDLLTVTKRSFGANEERPVSFIVFGAVDAARDTNAMVQYVSQMYE